MPALKEKTMSKDGVENFEPENLRNTFVPKTKSTPSPEDMIAHLKEKQEEDRKFYGQLLDYKSNSLNYAYHSQTLEVNFLLEDIFEESSYLLQAIRHIAKNNFFKEAKSPHF